MPDIKEKEITVDKAREMLEKVLTTSIVPFLWGPPGVGKSSLVREICAEHDWDLIDLRLSLLNPVDLRGLPTVDRKAKQAEWLTPSFLPKYNAPNKGILFLDEINLAPPSVQAAAYQLILDKRVGEYKFPKHWMIVAAGNRETDRANVYKMPAPLANRFIHFTITPNFNVWEQWAMQARIRPEIIDFLILRPALLFQAPKEGDKSFPTPRSWEFLSNLLDAFTYDEDSGVTQEVDEIIRGTIGEGTGKEFSTFLQDYKLKDVARKVESFKKTGKISMPKATSVRYALIVQVWDCYKTGTLDKRKYDAFVDKLSGEEKKSIAVYEEQYKDNIDKQYNPAALPSEYENQPIEVTEEQDE